MIKYYNKVKDVMKKRKKREGRRKEIPIIELLYVCDDDFKKDVQEIRDKFNIKTDKDGFVSTDDFIAFDKKILTIKHLQKKYTFELTKLCKKYNLLDSFSDLETFIETGQTVYDLEEELLKVNMTNLKLS